MQEWVQGGRRREVLSQFFRLNEQLFSCEVEHLIGKRSGRRGYMIYGDFDNKVNEIKPDFVFTCDSDEMYPEDFWPEFDEFKECDSLIMLHRGVTMCVEGEGGLYPYHCKVSKFRLGMSYYKGAGKNKPKYPGVLGKDLIDGAYKAEALLTHWPYFTPEMRGEREEYLKMRGMGGKLNRVKALWAGS